MLIFRISGGNGYLFLWSALIECKCAVAVAFTYAYQFQTTKDKTSEYASAREK